MKVFSSFKIIVIFILQFDFSTLDHVQFIYNSSHFNDYITFHDIDMQKKFSLSLIPYGFELN